MGYFKELYFILSNRPSPSSKDESSRNRLPFFNPLQLRPLYTLLFVEFIPGRCDFADDIREEVLEVVVTDPCVEITLARFKWTFLNLGTRMIKTVPHVSRSSDNDWK
mmetsp:Transcript_19125/g.31352  ORF Transcript_19125/g.31352 Transcript_19125/m.31352 type:complete len:107 (+) Transcript_19125:2176-2496(+)